MTDHSVTSVPPLEVRYLESPLLIDPVLKTNENLRPLGLIFNCRRFVVHALNKKSIPLPCDMISNNAD